jgi:hypothetical protein
MTIKKAAKQESWCFTGVASFCGSKQDFTTAEPGGISSDGRQTESCARFVGEKPHSPHNPGSPLDRNHCDPLSVPFFAIGDRSA